MQKCAEITFNRNESKAESCADDQPETQKLFRYTFLVLISISLFRPVYTIKRQYILSAAGKMCSHNSRQCS